MIFKDEDVDVVIDFKNVMAASSFISTFSSYSFDTIPSQPNSEIVIEVIETITYTSKI